MRQYGVSEILAALTRVRGRLANAEVIGARAGEIRVVRPSGLTEALSDAVSFFFSREYENEIRTARPGVLITGEPFAAALKAGGPPCWRESAVIACADPYLAMGLVTELMAEGLTSIAHLSALTRTEIHPTAVIDPAAELGSPVKIGAHCVVEAGARVGSGTVLYPGCYIGPRVTLGTGCVFFPGVKVYEGVRIGSGVRLHAGVVIGAEGFGYAPVLAAGGSSGSSPDLKNMSVVGHQKIYQLGSVVIGDAVEIGANSCVDRGTVSDTVIERFVKIDNLVQIGHNVRIEEGAILCGASAVAGSARIGKFAYIGGISGISNKVHVGDGAKIGACSLISKDVPAGGAAVGNPQREYHEHFRAHAALNKLVSRRRPPREVPKS